MENKRISADNSVIADMAVWKGCSLLFLPGVCPVNYYIRVRNVRMVLWLLISPKGGHIPLRFPNCWCTVQMAQPVQNINHSAFRSMFEREKLSRNNFNDWFRQLKLVLRVEKKMFVIEQPLPAAPAADSNAQVLSEWNALYDAYNEVACLMLGSMTPELHRQFENYSPYEMLQELKSMFEKQAGVERFDLIQTFHACKQEEGKPVAAYVLQMKGYVDQLERLGYMLPQDLIVGLILNGHTKDFAGFVRNYNMHNMGKMIGELHAMLIDLYPKPSAKEHPAKDGTTATTARRSGVSWRACERDTPDKLQQRISKFLMEVEGFEPPQKDVIPIRRSERTHRAPDRLCLNVEVEEHSLGDLNEPTSYKACIG
ncbi:hypothetical protein Tco_0418076 [Tanacetum coccineum]